jgi:hypothetical protein
VGVTLSTGILLLHLGGGAAKAKDMVAKNYAKVLEMLRLPHARKNSYCFKTPK